MSEKILEKYKVKLPVDIIFTLENKKYKKTISGLKNWKNLTENAVPENYDIVEKNVAILTGKINDLFVIDIDSKVAEDNFIKTFGALQELNCSIIKTRKGKHLYFKYSDSKFNELLMKCSTNSFKDYNDSLANIDIRSDGGVIFYGKNYVLEKFVENPSPIPEAIYKLFEDKTKPNRDANAIRYQAKVLEHSNKTNVNDIELNKYKIQYILNDPVYNDTLKELSENFHTWIKYSLAIKNTFGESGFEYFKLFSSKSSVHNLSETQLREWYTNLISSSKFITIGSIIYDYLQKGFKIPNRPKAKVEKLEGSIYELDIARLFLEYIDSSRWVFNKNEESFYYCQKDTNIWIKDDACRLSKLFYTDEFQKFIKSKIESEKNFVKLLKTYSSQKNIVNIIKALVPHDIEFNKTYLFAFKNGVYDLDKKIFREIVPTDYVSITCAHNYINKNYPDYKSGKVYSYINSNFENEVITDHLLQKFSLSLYGEQLDKSIYIWTGAGDNGKSKLQELNFISFGKEYAQTVNPSFFTEKLKNSNNASPEIHEARNARILLTSEPEENSVFNTSVIKKFTGKDMVKSRALNENPVSWVPKFDTHFACNDLPRFSDKSIGWANRVKILHFALRFVNEISQSNHRQIQEIDFDESFCEEYLCILINVWNSGNFKKEKLIVPDEMKIFAKEYIEGNDKNIVFINTCLEKVNDRNSQVTTTEMYERYNRWCDTFKISQEWRKKSKGLTDYLKLKDFVYVKNTNHRGTNYFECVRLKPEDNEVEEKFEEDSDDDGF